MDSIAREIDVMELAMYALDTNLVEYLLKEGYPVTGTTVCRLFNYAFEPELDVLAWYERLIPHVSHVDSIRSPGDDASYVLHDFCGGYQYVRGDTLETIFRDLIGRGADVNRKVVHNIYYNYGVVPSTYVPLDECRYKSPLQSERQKMLTDILLEYGADTSLAHPLDG